eukprot:UN5178
MQGDASICPSLLLQCKAIAPARRDDGGATTRQWPENGTPPSSSESALDLYALDFRAQHDRQQHWQKWRRTRKGQTQAQAMKSQPQHAATASFVSQGGKSFSSWPSRALAVVSAAVPRTTLVHTTWQSLASQTMQSQVAAKFLGRWCTTL